LYNRQWGKGEEGGERLVEWGWRSRWKKKCRPVVGLTAAKERPMWPIESRTTVLFSLILGEGYPALQGGWTGLLIGLNENNSVVLACIYIVILKESREEYEVNEVLDKC